MLNKTKLAVFLLLFSLFGFFNFVVAQEPVPIFNLAAQIKGDVVFFTTDHMGNVYIVESHQVKKYGISGNLQETFSNKNFGAIAAIDASNPLRVLVYYRDFGHIMFLDDELSLIGSAISLVALGLDQTTLICASWNDGIWLYDPQDFQLKRLDRNLKTTHQSGNINQLVGVEINPNYMVEYDNFVYLNNPQNGILVFDQYGTYFKTIPLKGLDQFQLNGEQVFFKEEGKLKSYNLKLFTENSVDLPGEKERIKRIRFERESKLLVIQKENYIDLFLIED